MLLNFRDRTPKRTDCRAIELLRRSDRVPPSWLMTLKNSNISSLDINHLERLNRSFVNKAKCLVLLTPSEVLMWYESIVLWDGNFGACNAVGFTSVTRVERITRHDISLLKNGLFCLLSTIGISGFPHSTAFSSSEFKEYTDVPKFGVLLRLRPAKIKSTYISSFSFNCLWSMLQINSRNSSNKLFLCPS
jgi:hypothetical protein